MSISHVRSLDALQLRIAHPFRDRTLLVRAVTHLSYLADHPDAGESNQRLEFLGDAVLQILIAEELFDLFPQEREGMLSKSRSLLVNGVFLAQLAREIGLDCCLRLGAGEESTGGRDRTSTLGDAFEALIGAIYLDANIDVARRVVRDIFGPLQDRLAAVGQEENPKGRLQELVQARHGTNALRYEVVQVGGHDHAREFEIAVHLLDRQLGRGRGPSKKLAEEAAARMALSVLEAEDSNRSDPA